MKTSKKPDIKSVDRFLTRAVERAYPSTTAFKKMLSSGKRLTVYLGVDPTGPSLHLGHAISMKKMRVLQDMGHRVILLIGDFTAMIGDPTDKAAVRKALTRKEVLENCKHYREQASRILDMDGSVTGNPVEIKYNNDWFGKMTFADVLDLTSRFTVQQMLERDMFERRIKDGKPVYVHEFLYPMMQAYDSVVMEVDIEIGGNDQTFNMLAGRDLVKSMQNREKGVLTVKLLTDPTGKKMGKSEGNMVTLSDTPEDMFGKVLSWTDGMILPGFELCTDVSDADIRKMDSAMKKGENPMLFKRRLAKEIVTAWHDRDSAESAEVHFDRLFKQHVVPEELPELKISAKWTVLDALAASPLVSSKGEARRQIRQGAVKLDHKKVTNEAVSVQSGQVLQKGKRGFIRLV